MNATASNTMFQITEEEKQEVRSLFNRKNAIRELLDSSYNNQGLFDKLTGEFVEVSTNFQNWFKKFEEKYQAVGAPGHFWSVDFDNNTVTLRQVPGKGAQK